jgi:hypothetical protein
VTRPSVTAVGGRRVSWTEKCGSMQDMEGVGSSTEVDAALPYVPRLLRDWTPTGDDERHMRVPGSLAFVDISGFTRLTERLARKGKVGAEEMRTS